jgi:hypothetical protein
LKTAKKWQKLLQKWQKPPKKPQKLLENAPGVFRGLFGVKKTFLGK